MQEAIDWAYLLLLSIHESVPDAEHGLLEGNHDARMQKVLSNNNLTALKALRRPKIDARTPEAITSLAQVLSAVAAVLCTRNSLTPTAVALHSPSRAPALTRRSAGAAVTTAARVGQLWRRSHTRTPSRPTLTSAPTLTPT